MTIVTIIIFTALFGYFVLPRLVINTRINAGTPEIKAKTYPNSLNVSITTKDSIHIQGVFMQTEKQPKATIILLHGIKGYKEHFDDLSQVLSDSGYNTLAIDLRGHRNSGGQYCTFGYSEKYDVQSVIDFLLNEQKVDSNIGIWGQSLGGAIALQTLAIEPRLKFGIIESTFGDLDTIIQDYATRTIGFNFPLLGKYLVYRAGQIAEFEPQQVSPRIASKSITQPMFLAHGNKDVRIKLEYNKQNFNNLKSENKTFLEIDGANHLNLWEMGADDYFGSVFKFLNSLDK